MPLGTGRDVPLEQEIEIMHLSYAKSTHLQDGNLAMSIYCSAK